MPAAKDHRITILRYIVYLGGLVPLAWLLFDLFNGGLGVNPIQAATKRSGVSALVLLILTIAITPLQTITGYKQWGRLRRPLGLFSFLYAAIHLIIFVAIDYGFAWDLIWLDSADKRFIWVGLSAFAILAALAFTSFDHWKKAMRKNWKRLHRLVYLAALLVILHFAWAVKGDLAQLSGEVIRPVLFGLAIVLLLVLRLKPVRQAVVRLRERWKKPKEPRIRSGPRPDLPDPDRG